jgi:nucleoid DNA-binding protein
MNRRTFAAQIAKKTGHPANALETILEAAIAVLAEELAHVGRFEWRGLGTFTVRAYPARKIHNPATHQVIALPPRKSIAFKPSPKLRAGLITRRKGDAKRHSRRR